MNCLTLFLKLISTNGKKASKLIDLPKIGFNSKLGSLEIQAKWMRIS